MLSKRPKFGPRWWLFAAVSFAILLFLLMPFTGILLIYLGIAVAAKPPQIPLIIPVALFLTTAAALGAVIVASAAETLLRRSGRPDQSKASPGGTLIIVLVFLSPALVVGVGAFIVDRWLDADEKRGAPIRAYNSRPIGLSDTVGFCSAVSWRMDGILPRASVAVRVPAPGRYRLRVTAFDRAGHHLEAVGLQDFSAGVDTVSARLYRSGRGNDSTSWPIVVESFALITEGVEPLRVLDQRIGDSLFILNRSTLRPE
jgi:hypothetical protein